MAYLPSCGHRVRAVGVPVPLWPWCVQSHQPYWTGPMWHGVAHLDGVSGSEIVVGQTMGLHARLYRVLTWRHGQRQRRPPCQWSVKSASGPISAVRPAGSGRESYATGKMRSPLDD